MSTKAGVIILIVWLLSLIFVGLDFAMAMCAGIIVTILSVMANPPTKND